MVLVTSHTNCFGRNKRYEKKQEFLKQMDENNNPLKNEKKVEKKKKRKDKNEHWTA